MIKIVILALGVHILMLLATSDIYFSSPIDNGMSSTKSTGFPAAKRLVLIVADGLRLDTLYDAPEADFPNLNSIRKHRSSWGVSHTRVPTESRPGHVALLGGIYEDPSAIFKGWQANPVNFDSVINQSTNAWCWGSPDIVNLFNRDNLPHIQQFTYDANLEDFGKSNTSALDLWVFSQVEQFLENIITCENCTERHTKGILFFLHLLGTDTAGHGFKPYSKEYKSNVKLIDEYIPKVESLFERAFPDKRTAYVFTSDHGMTDWGSHGAGLDVETLTPLIVWGPGVKIEDTPKSVKQIDIAPLIASLIGINLPSNSLGKLPYKYFQQLNNGVGQLLISNVEQIMKIVEVKYSRTEKNALFFDPFRGYKLTDYYKKIEHLQQLLDNNQIDELVDKYEQLFTILIEAINYYHNYYKNPLLFATTFGFLLWVLYLGMFTTTKNILYFNKSTFKKIRKYSTIINFLIFTLINILTFTQSLPLSYYLYFSFPNIMFQIIIQEIRQLFKLFDIIKEYGSTKFLKQFLLYLLGGELLFLGFYYKFSYSLLLFLIPIWTHVTIKREVQKDVLNYFTCGCGILSIFPMLPDMSTTFSLILFMFGGILFWTGTNKLIDQLPPYNRTVLVLQHYLYKTAFFFTLAVQQDFIEVDSSLKNLSWFLMGGSILLIFISTDQVPTRLTSIVLGFSSYYIMMTVNYEMLFLACYIVTLAFWLRVESKQFSYRFVYNLSYSDYELSRAFYTDDYRIGFYYITFIFIGFFGTGNIASLNAFDPMWVKCFLTIFSPFKMITLIIGKIAIPFIFATCILKTIYKIYRGQIFRRWCIVMLFADIILLKFFYYIINVGSWLEIGMSLSHFIIMEAFIIIILVMHAITYLLTRKSCLL